MATKKSSDQNIKKLLQETIIFVGGKPAEGVSNLLDGKKYLNEFIIAKKLDITVNQVRNILYRLSEKGIVSSTRKKDKKKGWYTYFWKIEILKSLEFLREIIKHRIEQFENQIKSRETKQFYVCNRCNIEFTEETALFHNFTCDECGEVFSIKDNTKVLREFEKQKDRLNLELKEVENELNSERGKEDKIRQKGVEKERKEKEKEKEKKKIERRKLAEKEKKKAGKSEKKPVKKVIKKVVKKSIKKSSKKNKKKR